MQLAIYVKVLKEEYLAPITKLIKAIKKLEVSLIFHEYIHKELVMRKLLSSNENVFSHFDSSHQNLPKALITIGGDGTILDSLTIVKDAEIPVLGINAGRLGFLAVSSFDTILLLIKDLQSGNYLVEKRSLLSLSSSRSIFSTPFALNDFVLHKKDSSSMITVHTFLNGQYLTSYWADGLIIATPTGSTGYSLSCGGPIMFPKAKTLVITPIAPHNLNMRPVVIPDDQVITFELEGRSKTFMAALDARSMNITTDIQLAIKKADISFHLIRTHNHNFLETLRKKMNWGLDTRNN